MVIYFTEEDLVSFGSYMISKDRRKFFELDPTVDDIALTEKLGRVNETDIQNWAYLLNQKLTNE